MEAFLTELQQNKARIRRVSEGADQALRGDSGSGIGGFQVIHGNEPKAITAIEGLQSRLEGKGYTVKVEHNPRGYSQIDFSHSDGSKLLRFIARLQKNARLKNILDDNRRMGGV